MIPSRAFLGALESRVPESRLARASGQCAPSRRDLLRVAAGIALAPVAERFAQGEAGGSQPGVLAARAVTRGPNHHFFGYYDKCPWDSTGRYLLAMEINFVGRQPEPREPLTVGMVALKDAERYIPLDTTVAWSWQQGTMLQWVGPQANREVIYNAFADGQYVSVIRDVHSGKTRTLPRPIYAISRDGRQAVTLNFDRVNRLRPGYGYMMFPDRHEKVAAPSDAGIYHMDLHTGRNKLIISLEWAADNKPDGRFRGAQHWFNHLEFNPSGTRFIFLHRWKGTGKTWYSRMYTARPDGSDIRLHADWGTVSHFDWRHDDTILAWARAAGKGLAEQPKDKPGKTRPVARFWLFDVDGAAPEVLGDGVLKQDGHCSYSPDGQWLLVDTYPDRQGLQHLMLYRLRDDRCTEIGAFMLPKSFRGKPWRCDLHPRWNRDGTQVCIDSAHEATRQVYVIDVSSVTRT